MIFSQQVYSPVFINSLCIVCSCITASATGCKKMQQLFVINSFSPREGSFDRMWFPRARVWYICYIKMKSGLLCIPGMVWFVVCRTENAVV